MNISCSICSDLFQSSDTIVTTSCGHCFHYHCLLHWLERSKTCPECRRRCTQSDTKGIFLNILSNAEDDSIINKLTLLVRSKDETIRSLNGQIIFYQDLEQSRIKKIKDLEEEINQKKEKENEYKTTIMNLEKAVKLTKEEIQKLRAKNAHFQSENTELNKKVEVLKKVEDKLKLQERSKAETIKSLKEQTIYYRDVDWSRIKQIKDLKEEIDQKKEVESKYKKAIMDLKESVKTTEASYKEEIQKFKTENAHVQSDNTELKKKVEVMKKIKDKLMLQGRSKDETIERLKAQMSFYRERLDEKIKEKMKYKKTIMDLEKSVKTTEAAYKEEIQQLRTENAHVQSKLEEKLSTLENENCRLEHELTKLNNRLTPQNQLKSIPGILYQEVFHFFSENKTKLLMFFNLYFIYTLYDIFSTSDHHFG